MSVRVEVVLLLNLALVGLLPRLLFRDGRLNAAWWATAAPLLATAATSIAALIGWLQPAVATPGLAYAATALATASMLLIACTIGTHRRRISMWHQSHQQSAELVTCGPYALVRHPLYSSFQLTLLAGALAVPHAITVAAFVYGVAQFRRTAVIEEQRLMASGLGNDYREYADRVGRFLPRPSQFSSRAGRASGRSRPALHAS